MGDNHELPKAGDTTPPDWRPTTTESPGTVSMAEAVELWKVSERTLRRRLGAGEIPGAHKVPTAKGEEWRIPAAALGGLGYKRTDAPAPATPGLPDGLDLGAVVGELRDAAQQWRELAATTRLELVGAEQDRLTAHTKAARLEAELVAAKADTDRERERADALAAELAEARKPRKRWGRSAK